MINEVRYTQSSDERHAQSSVNLSNSPVLSAYLFCNCFSSAAILCKSCASRFGGCTYFVNGIGSCPMACMAFCIAWSKSADAICLTSKPFLRNHVYISQTEMSLTKCTAIAKNLPYTVNGSQWRSLSCNQLHRRSSADAIGPEHSQNEQGFTRLWHIYEARSLPAKRSSGCSIPTEMRTRWSGRPRAALTSAGMEAWLM